MKLRTELKKQLELGRNVMIFSKGDVWGVPIIQMDWEFGQIDWLSTKVLNANVTNTYYDDDVDTIRICIDLERKYRD